MNLEKFRELTKKVVTSLDNQELVTELLSQMDTAFEEVTVNQTSLTEQVNKHNETIESNKETISNLRDANMQLFLKIGHQNKDDQGANKQDDKKEEPEMTFDTIVSEFVGGE